MALGNTIKHGIKVQLVDINTSQGTFIPNAEDNYIQYGFRSLAGIGYEFIQKIVSLRPFLSLEDFFDRVEPDKTQMTNLIKAGAFMSVDSQDRKISLLKYAKKITPKRKTLSIAQIPLLVRAQLLDIERYSEPYRFYEFNRYITKQLPKQKGGNIVLDERAISFLDSMGLESYYSQEQGQNILDKKMWSKKYTAALDPIRDFLKGNKEKIIESLRVYETVETFKEFGEGSVPKWEMQSMSFYYSGHELDPVNYEDYNIVSFGDLPRKPNKIASGKWFRMETNSIIGTVIGKNKTKGSVDLLTREGDVVLVKMSKDNFSYWDRQISERQPDGSKKVIEKSWFQRGNKLFLHGYRNDDQFRKLSYSKEIPSIGLITDIGVDGKIKMLSNRAQ